LDTQTHLTRPISKVTHKLKVYLTHITSRHILTSISSADKVTAGHQ